MGRGTREKLVQEVTSMFQSKHNCFEISSIVFNGCLCFTDYIIFNSIVCLISFNYKNLNKIRSIYLGMKLNVLWFRFRQYD